jgi:electron transfer flavoprotein alpha subunit
MNGDKLPLIAEAVITDLLAKNSRLEEEVEYLHNELASMRTGPQSKLLEENRNLRHELAVLVHGIDAESERLREQLVASQVECEEQARLNGMGTEREAALLARLQESQAREAQLREALVTATTVIEPYVWSKEEALIASAIALPHDDTALREYRKKVLLEAAERIGSADFISSPEASKSYAEYNELRRMAEEE